MNKMIAVYRCRNCSVEFSNEVSAHYPWYIADQDRGTWHNCDWMNEKKWFAPADLIRVCKAEDA